MKKFQGICFIALAAVSSPAWALTTLRQVQVADAASGGDRVDLLFDSKLSDRQIRTEFFNDVIQISLSDVAVYPAKISSVNGASLSKVFAYQYAPKLVRCRFTVRGKAEDFKGRVQVVRQGRTLTVRLPSSAGEQSDQIALRASAPQRAPAVEPRAEAKAAEPAAATASAGGNREENELMERVLKGTEKPAAASEAPASQRQQPLAGGRALPSPWRAMAKLAAVLALFLGIAATVSRMRKGGDRKLKGAISRFARIPGLGARKEKMIEIVSTHYLGPKKSIAVARIAGKLLVLGISNESINLITRIEEGGDLDLDALMDSDALGAPVVSAPAPAPAPAAAKTQAQSAIPAAYRAAGAVAAGSSAMFADILTAEKVKPAAPTNAMASNVRARIRSRLEGLKPL